MNLGFAAVPVDKMDAPAETLLRLIEDALAQRGGRVLSRD